MKRCIATYKLIVEKLLSFEPSASSIINERVSQLIHLDQHANLDLRNADIVSMNEIWCQLLPIKNIGNVVTDHYTVITIHNKWKKTSYVYYLQENTLHLPFSHNKDSTFTKYEIH